VLLPGNRHGLPVRLVMIAAAAGLFLIGYQWGNQYKRPAGPPAIAGVLVAPPIDLSDFSLQDPDGRPVTRDRLAQGWTLLTYGDLTQAQGHLAASRLLEVYNRLTDQPDLRAALRLILVQSLLDAPNLARDFNRLSPALIIVAGDAEQRDLLAEALGGAKAPPPGDNSGSAVFVIAPGARMVALFTPGQGAATMAADLVALFESPDLLSPPPKAAAKNGAGASPQQAPSPK
jgi:hypothetical protein